jgi:hypothetical protein
MNSKSRVVKVQIPLAGEPICLVYGENHSNMRQQTITPKNLKDLKGDIKGYFEATLNDETDVWDIGKRVNEQDW